MIFWSSKHGDVSNISVLLAASWETNEDTGGAPNLKGARFFSFEEIKKYTNNFPEINEIGSGGFGKVSELYT